MTNRKNNPDPASPLSPEWFRELFSDVTREYLRDAFKAVPGTLKHRPGTTFWTALSYACERDAEITRITSAKGSEHWVVRKDGTIIGVFPDLDPKSAEHPDLKHLSDDIFVPGRGLAEQLPKKAWWPFGRRARLLRLAPSADREPQE